MKPKHILPIDPETEGIPAHEHWIKASEIIAGLQPRAVEVIEDVADKRIIEMTVLELVEFIEYNCVELNPFWD